MPKFEIGGNVKKINLAHIIETGNVRDDYSGIDELAATIKTNGQLQPVLVKAHGRNTDGIDEFELVAGHRRVRAFRHLCESGDDFNRIDAVVVTGDKLTLQLIENLQRADLSPQERERGIYEMTKGGKVSQRDVAAMLGKNEQFISRNISAFKIRELAEKAGMDTSGISTNTLCEIAGSADGDIPHLIERIKNEGGTLAAARRVRREYQGEAETSPEPDAETEPESPSENDPGFDDGGDEEFSGDALPLNIEIETAPSVSEDETRFQNAPQRKPLPKPEPRETRTLADFAPQHRQVDMNDVLVVIKDYIDSFAEALDAGLPAAKYMTDAGWDLIALLHERL